MCRRGDIYYADLGAPTGCCQSRFRPVLIVSNNTANVHAPVITVVPITSRYKAMHMPTHVVLHRCAVTGLTHRPALRWLSRSPRLIKHSFKTEWALCWTSSLWSRSPTRCRYRSEPLTRGETKVELK